MLDRVKNHPFVAGFCTMFVIGAAVATVYLCLDAKHHETQNARIDDLKEQVQDKNQQLQERKDDSSRYAQELALNRELGVKYADAKARCESQADKLKEAEQWEGKYKTERVARESAEEGLALATTRYKANLAAVTEDNIQLRNRVDRLEAKAAGGPATQPTLAETMTTFDRLLAEKASLQNQVTALNHAAVDRQRGFDLEVAGYLEKIGLLTRENERLCQLLKHEPEVTVLGPQKPQSKEDKPVAPKQDREKLVSGIIAAVNGLRNSDARIAIVTAVPHVEGGISGEELAAILKSADLKSSEERRMAIISVAYCLRHPLDPKALDDILEHLDSTDRRYATYALIEAASKAGVK